MTVDPALGGLTFQYVFNKGGYFADSLPRLLLHKPCQAVSFSKEELEGDESDGSLRCLSDGKQDVGDQEILIVSILYYHPSEHHLQDLVEALNVPVDLGVIH